MGKDKTQTTSSEQYQSGQNYGQQSGTFNNQQMGGTNQMQGLDPNSQAFVDWQRSLAQQGAGAALGSAGTLGPNAGMLQALQAMGAGGANYAALSGQLGQVAGGLLGGDPLMKQTQQLMNPYIQGVVDPTRAEFDNLRNMARRDATGAALRGGVGAFGSARHGVAEGTRLGELDRAQASQIAGLLSGGYDRAQQAALQLQQQAGGALGGLGSGLAGMSAQDLQREQMLFDNYSRVLGLQQGQANDPAARYAMALQFANQGLGPTGSQGSSTNYGMQSGTSSGQQTGGYTGTTTGNTTQTQPGNLMGDLLGLGTLGLGIYNSVRRPPGGVPQGYAQGPTLDQYRQIAYR